MATVRERVVELIGGVTPRQLETAVQRQEGYWQSKVGELTRQHQIELGRAYEAGYNDGGEDEPSSGDIKKYGYRRSISHGLRDFSGIEHAAMLEIVWTLWQSSLIAKRLLCIKRDHIVDKGIKMSAADNELQNLLDQFEDNNHFERRVREFALQLFLFGEQCFPAFVRESDGRVMLGYIDPEQIESVITDPENAMETWAVVVKPETHAVTWAKAHDRRVYRIVRKVEKGKNKDRLATAEQATAVGLEAWEMEMLEAMGLNAYSGSCFYEKVNSVSNQPRGYSDLLQLADWIDQADETLFALADREQMAGYFSWDVTLTGADDGRVKTRSREIRSKPPKKGSVNIHNDAEAWTFNYPDLKTAASIETFNALLTFVLGGEGFPRHWFGFGDGANRATADAQGDPTWKSLAHDQAIVCDLIGQMAQFVRDQAIIAGQWQGNDETITIVPSEMNAKDIARITGGLNSLAVALLTAVDEQWVSRETAAQIWAKMMGELGVVVDVATEMNKAAADDQRIPLTDVANANAKLLTLGVNGHGDGSTPVNLETTKGLNGAQITAVLQVLDNLRQGTAVALVAQELLTAVGIDPDRAKRMVDATLSTAISNPTPTNAN